MLVCKQLTRRQVWEPCCLMLEKGEITGNDNNAVVRTEDYFLDESQAPLEEIVIKCSRCDVFEGNGVGRA